METRIEEDASRWYAGQDGDDMDWDAFTEWLEADPRHRRAFDEIALLGRRIGDNREMLRERLDAAEPLLASRAAGRSPNRLMLAGVGAAAAAILALMTALPGSSPPAAGPTTYRSASGQTRTLALADGTRIMLASASRLTISGDRRDITIEGSGYFDVPHRPGRVLRIRAGELTVSDIGTRFAVSAAPGAVQIEVAEGTLSVSSEALDSTVPLASGQALIADTALRQISLTSIAQKDVARWRQGQLRYANAPLALVAGDVSRYAGMRVTVAPALSGQHFSGVLTIGDGSKLVGTLADILGVEARSAKDGIRLEPRSRP